MTPGELPVIQKLDELANKLPLKDRAHFYRTIKFFSTEVNASLAQSCARYLEKKAKEADDETKKEDKGNEV